MPFSTEPSSFPVATVPYVQPAYTFAVGLSSNVPASNTSTYTVADEQAWFTSDTWQIGEREADADIAAGRLLMYDSGDDFLASI